MNQFTKAFRLLAREKLPSSSPSTLMGFVSTTKKTKTLIDKTMTEKEVIDKFVKNGDYLGFELYGTVRCPMSLTRELVLQEKDFRIVGQGVHELDLMFGADLVREIDFTTLASKFMAFRIT